MARGVVLALLVVGWVLAALAGCALHPGGQEIAFLRAGQLVAINPDGSDPRMLSSGSVVSFAWSPDHHQLVYRSALHPDTAELVPVSTVGPSDARGALNVISINGGRSTQITPDAPQLTWSDAWWNRNGNRLVYREAFATNDIDATAPAYIVSQADQPVGIARKTLPDAASIPTLSPDGSQAAAIDGDGTLRIGAPGQPGQAVARGALLTLPGTGRPGRVLWQPGQDALLYTTASGSNSSNTAIMLRDAHGATHTITTVPMLLDLAFAPNGGHLLLRAPAGFQLVPLATSATPAWTLPESDPAALAWWSPDGHWLLVQDVAGWRLINVATGSARTLVSYGGAVSSTAVPAQAQWHPAAGSPWSPDGTQFVFVGMSGATWLGKSLPRPNHNGVGLYVASLANGQPASQAMLIGSGADRVPDWSYADPNTTLLVAS
jgi:hypothetical protein